MMIFEIINFLIRIGIVVYIVKRYVAVSILSAIKQEKQALKLLQERKESLQSACAKVEDNSKKEQQRLHELEEKFKLWSHAVAVVQVEQEVWCQAQHKKIEQHVEQKTKFLQQQKIIKNQMPEILNAASVSLIKKFKDDASLAKAYQVKLLEILQK